MVNQKEICVEVLYKELFPEDPNYQLLVVPKTVIGDSCGDFIRSARILGRIQSSTELLVRLKLFLYRRYCVAIPNNQLKSVLVFDRKSVTVSFIYNEPRKRVKNDSNKMEQKR